MTWVSFACTQYSARDNLGEMGTSACPEEDLQDHFHNGPLEVLGVEPHLVEIAGVLPHLVRVGLKGGDAPPDELFGAG